MLFHDEDAVPYRSAEKIGVTPPRFVLPAESRIGSVTLQVADLELSIMFYEKVFGFELIAHQEQTATAQLGAPGGKTILLNLREKRGAKPIPADGLLGLYHFAILLPKRADLAYYLHRFAAMRIPFSTADHFYSEAIYIVGPDGITVELAADRSTDKWMVSEKGEIIGATAELDSEKLAAQAKNYRWSGLPRNSKIGHVHFYIGDLKQAEAFYHRALGMAKVNWSFPGALFVSAGAYHHHVGLNNWSSYAPVATDDDARLLLWDLILPDQATRQAAQDSLTLAGYNVLKVEDDVIAEDPWSIRVRLLVESAH